MISQYNLEILIFSYFLPDEVSLLSLNESLIKYSTCYTLNYN